MERDTVRTTDDWRDNGKGCAVGRRHNWAAGSACIAKEIAKRQISFNYWTCHRAVLNQRKSRERGYL
jgi:hypothetical protein